MSVACRSGIRVSRAALCRSSQVNGGLLRQRWAVVGTKARGVMFPAPRIFTKASLMDLPGPGQAFLHSRVNYLPELEGFFHKNNEMANKE